MGRTLLGSSSFFIVAILLPSHLLASTVVPYEYNITSYTRSLPPELRDTVKKALTAERQLQFGRLQKEDLCPEGETQEDTCPPSKFRTQTGECNNVRHPKWGNRGVPFLRLLPPQYADGISKPRTSVGTHALPSVLDVVSTLQTIPERKHESVTALVGAWSELLLHDLANTGNLRSQDCCSEDADKHAECYGRMSNGQCREYMRSLPAVDPENCTFEHREQMNLASAFLDGSAVYGNTRNVMEKLRAYDSGLVNVTACQPCRTNALYSAILREHNRIAINLGQLNRHWADEELFYESKRIVTAEIQHITYNEFLPIVLGEEAAGTPDLRLKTVGHFSEYSSSRKGGIYNEVAMASLPALLSTLPSSLMNETATTFAEMVDVLMRTPAQEPSVHIAVSLRTDWDTAALFLHMGRDHGLPSYPKMLEYCRNSTEFKSFDDLIRVPMKEEYVRALEYIYRNLEDVDLMTGALLEGPVPGAIVGPTLQCMLQKQFALLRRSDRFWYENDLPPSSLTTEQLKEIRKITLAGLLCANTDDFDRIQPKAFVQEDPYLNAPIPCDQHPLPQLTAFLEMDHMVDVSEEMLMDALSKAAQDLMQRRKQEYQLWTKVGGVDPKSPLGTAAAFSKANKLALEQANTSLLYEFASNEIVNSLVSRRRKRQIFDNTVLPAVLRDELAEGLQNVDITNLLPAHSLEHGEEHCDDLGPCDPSSPFRTLTGYCNNLRNPNWGKSLTPFARLLPSTYEDGVRHPRIKCVTGDPLPSPRIVSTVIHPDISNLHSRYSLMFMQYAQFLDHDLTMTPIAKGFFESIPDCRPCDSARTVHPECNPFPVPPGDHYYPEVNITSGERMCFPSMRSLPGQLGLGPREQMNQNTAFLDASQVYGENECILKKLRGYGGRLNSSIPNKGKELLPQSSEHPECKAASGLCYIAGDGRASEQPALTMIHTIFLREHNRIVEGLRIMNPHWDDDKLFEHARRIVIAENQHLTYNEFLPRLLSWNAVNLYGLKLLPQGYYKDYTPTCNPSILNEFATAAFRIGHSLLRPHIPRLSPNYQIVDPPILLRDGFFKPDMFQLPGMTDEIARGMLSTPMETMDQFITGEVTNHLFENKKIPFSGVDLIALNIQRARDHGISGYNNYRALCNLKKATTFEDLSREIPPEVIVRLKRIYPTVDDIDLFPGGMSERPLQGGLLGPTFACIVAIQFRQLRKCDRFWYENDDPAVRFTEAQLAEIRKITLAKIMCDNMDVNSDMQRAAFDLPSNFLNPRVPCQSLPHIDLSAWKETTRHGCQIRDRRFDVGESAFPTPCMSCICTREGPQCASLRITDCSRLMREWSPDDIFRDEVCTAQCGFQLQQGTSQRSRAINTDLVPPPSSHVRPRQLSPLRTRFETTSPLSGFKFPDLTPFIAK